MLPHEYAADISLKLSSHEYLLAVFSGLLSYPEFHATANRVQVSLPYVQYYFVIRNSRGYGPDQRIRLGLMTKVPFITVQVALVLHRADRRQRIYLAPCSF